MVSRTSILRVLILILASTEICNARKMEVTDPLNSFGYKLLGARPPGENIMISPYSISTAFAMLNAGTAGDTKSQIDAAFGWSEIQDLSGQYRKLLSTVSSGGGNVFNMTSANRLYVDNSFQPLKSYSKTLSRNFDADLEKVNFGSGDNSDTVQDINSWVSDQTNGKIKKMFEEIDSNTRAILINTVYFNAEWLKPFSEKTTKRRFYFDEDNHVMTDTMTVMSQFNVLRTEGAEVVKIPYKAGKSDISMIVIKPTKRGGLMELEKNVIRSRFAKLKKWIKKVDKEYPSSVLLSMPKFQFGSKISNIKEILRRKFAVTDVFDAGLADLSGISGNRDLFVSSIIHQSFILVDEKRTEAAAATSITATFRARPSSVTIDSPFLFLIYDHRNKVVLFLGRVFDPRISG